jgi:hypothetical protein
MGDRNESVVDTIEDRVQNIEEVIDDAAKELEKATSARESELRGALNDIALNVGEGKDEIGELVTRAKNGEIRSLSGLAINMVEVANKNREGLAAGAGTGAYIGSFGGPIGSILGATAGTSAVYLYEANDGRRVVAVPLDPEDVPEEASPTPSSEEPLSDNRTLQSLLDQGVEESEAVEDGQSLTRLIDIDGIEECLSEIGYVETSDGTYDGHYIDHQGTVFAVFIDDSGEPIEQ